MNKFEVVLIFSPELATNALKKNLIILNQN